MHWIDTGPSLAFLRLSVSLTDFPEHLQLRNLSLVLLLLLLLLFKKWHNDIFTSDQSLYIVNLVKSLVGTCFSVICLLDLCHSFETVWCTLILCLLSTLHFGSKNSKVKCSLFYIRLFLPKLSTIYACVNKMSKKQWQNNFMFYSLLEV